MPSRKSHPVVSGVLTKPDRIPRGEEERWTNFIKNEERPLDNGWFAVKQPDSKAIQEGITWEESRAKEYDFFAFTPPWSTLDCSTQQHLGTSYVTEQLSNVLSSLIAKRYIISSRPLRCAERHY